jgi:ATP-dependent helicase/nuclease subunit A
VLGQLYPGRPVRAALLWTETPELMEILTPMLDAALASCQAGATELDPAASRS